MSSTTPESNSPLPKEVIEGEARLFDLLYLKVSNGDAAVSAVVVQTIDPDGPMKALWLMARANVARKRKRMRWLTAPLLFFRQPNPNQLTFLAEPSAEEKLLSLAEAIRDKRLPTEAPVKAA
jgi:hypothetical protein